MITAGMGGYKLGTGVPNVITDLANSGGEYADAFKEGYYDYDEMQEREIKKRYKELRKDSEFNREMERTLQKQHIDATPEKVFDEIGEDFVRYDFNANETAAIYQRMQQGYDKDELCKVILEGKKAGKMHNLVLLAEGVGGASELAKYIEDKTGIETRATVLGHIQRGGAPSAFDRVLASRMGSKAIELLMEGKTSKVVGIKDNEIFDQDIDEALALDRRFDKELYRISEEISK